MDSKQSNIPGYLVTIKKSVLPKDSIFNLKETKGELISEELFSSIPQLNIVTCWLNRYIRITIQDKREFIGILKAMDKACNLILSETIEFPASNTALYKNRMIGLVVIPGIYIIKIQDYRI